MREGSGGYNFKICDQIRFKWFYQILNHINVCYFTNVNVREDAT